jgi:hypothetical protein
VNSGAVQTGLGRHIISGLGCLRFAAALFCWLPWLRSAETAIQSIVYCATDPALADQTGLYYSDCAPRMLASDRAADMEDAYRLWEMSERMAGLSS